MKFKSFLVLLTGLFLFTACETDSIGKVQSKTEVTAILKTTDPRTDMFTLDYWEHYDYFDSVPDSQKKLMWDFKYAQLNTLSWTTEEQGVIDSIFGYLHIDIFTPTSTRSQDLDSLRNELLDYVLTVFSRDEVVRIFMQPQDYDENIGHVYAVPGGGDTPNCNCEWDLSCSSLPQDRWCEGNSCEETSRGCGWFWISGCAHICDKGLTSGEPGLD